MLVDATRPGAPLPKTVRTLAVMGDSIGVGVGDPAATGGWRGFAPLLATAMGCTELVNVATNGARSGCVRSKQLPLVLRAKPDAVVVFVGMNDTMRTDFDPVRLSHDLDRVLTDLLAAGTLVATVRYHDHGQVFRVPGPLRRVLAARVEQLNAALDAVAHRHQVGVVDLGRLPGIYQRASWSVDRLHPSELGHRLLAKAFAERFAVAGVLVPGEISLDASGGAVVSGLDHAVWLVVKGIPWLWRRGRDIVPYLARSAVRDMLARRAAERAERAVAGNPTAARETS